MNVHEPHKCFFMERSSRSICRIRKENKTKQTSKQINKYPNNMLVGIINSKVKLEQGSLYLLFLIYMNQKFNHKKVQFYLNETGLEPFFKHQKIVR